MSRRAIACALFTVLLIGGLGLAALGWNRAWTGEAFGAFYCAGAAIAAGESPYTVEPLRSCEHRVWQGVTTPEDVAEPAPLPGYALAPFVLLAKVPYRFACVLFATLSIAAIVASAYILSEISELSIAVTLGGLIVVGYLNVYFGEIPQFAIFFLCAAAACVVAGRDRLAAIACAAAMIEPHMALAGVVSLFAWRPRSRLILCLSAPAFALLSMLLLGPSVALSYVTSVLPLHARSEINADDQYSLTWLAHALGASDTTSLVLGACSYAILMILGVLFAQRTAQAFRARALIVLFPVAATTLFGSFIHDIQIPVAMPAALIIAGACAGGSRVIAWIPVCILAVSWQPWWIDRQMTLFGAAALACIAAFMPGNQTVLQRAARVIGILFAFRVAQLVVTHLSDKPLFALASSTAWPPLGKITAHDPASLNWGAYVYGISANDASPELFATKALVWFALLVILGEGAFAIWGTRRLSPRRKTL